MNTSTEALYGDSSPSRSRSPSRTRSPSVDPPYLVQDIFRWSRIQRYWMKVIIMPTNIVLVH